MDDSFFTIVYRKIKEYYWGQSPNYEAVFAEHSNRMNYEQLVDVFKVVDAIMSERSMLEKGKKYRLAPVINIVNVKTNRDENDFKEKLAKIKPIYEITLRVRTQEEFERETIDRKITETKERQAAFANYVKELKQMTKVSANSRRRNLICNFRAPDLEHYQIWLNFKKGVRNQGLDICFVTLSLCQAWLRGSGITATCKILTPTQIINLQQQNTFVYSVQKPRRKPPQLFCSRKELSRTLSNLAYQAYVTEKARDLQRSFSFRDYLELEHSFFRKCIFRLKKREKVIPLLPRTNPRYYILQEWRNLYPTMSWNNRVKPRFSVDSPERGE